MGSIIPPTEPCPIHLPQPHGPWQPCPSSPSLQQMLLQRSSEQGFSVVFINFPPAISKVYSGQTLPEMPPPPPGSPLLRTLPCKASLRHSSPGAYQQLSPVKQSGFFPSALEATCSMSEHLVVATLICLDQ